MEEAFDIVIFTIVALGKVTVRHTPDTPIPTSATVALKQTELEKLATLPFRVAVVIVGTTF